MGGQGVGRVTKPGLACGVGEPAINPVPRQMISKIVRKLAEELDYRGLIRVTISIPEGEDLAKQTFNPRLGIVGGISVLGTSGRVEPMSDQALIDTIKAEVNVKHASGRKLAVLTPGNYGRTFLEERTTIPDISTIKISNFLGEALDMVAQKGFEGVLLSAHLGKLAKVSVGIMNTHSRYGDHRMEALAHYAGKCGVDQAVIDQLDDSMMVDQALAIFDQAGVKDQVMAALVEGADEIIKKRLAEAGANPVTAVMTFSNKYGLLAKSHDFDRVLDMIEDDENRRTDG